ncbi:MAG: hypothetical protein ACYCUY_08135, partial [Acidithiobacillus sp.]
RVLTDLQPEVRLAGVTYLHQRMADAQVDRAVRDEDADVRIAAEKKLSARVASQIPPPREQLPRMESALKTPEGTWYSSGVYVDKEGQLKATVRISNKESGVDESHKVSFEERTPNGDRYYSAKIERENKPTLYMNVQTPNVKAGEIRIARADFTEFHPEEQDKDRRFERVQGQGGWLKPNEAILKNAENNRTAAFFREKLDVDPVKQVEQSKVKAKGVER